MAGAVVVVVAVMSVSQVIRAVSVYVHDNDFGGPYAIMIGGPLDCFGHCCSPIFFAVDD